MGVRVLYKNTICMKRIFVFILMCISSIIWAQEDVSSEALNDRIYFKKFNGDNFDLTINDLVIDQNNRVIAASDKLLFAVPAINMEHVVLWENEYFTTVCVDDQNRVYAAGNSTLYMVNQEKKVELPRQMEITDITYLNNTIWVGTVNGLFTYNLETYTWDEYNTRNSKMISDHIHFAQADTLGNVWLGTKKGYVKISPKKWEVQDKKENVVCSRNNKEGQWMVSDDDMWLIDPYNRKYNIGLENNMYSGKINDFILDSKGRLYMASNILVRYDPYEEKIEQFGKGAGIISKRCLSLATDKNDKVWLGTERDGLYYISFDKDEQIDLTASLLIKNKISCAGRNDGSILLNIAGGKEPYAIQWKDGPTATTERERLTVGTYTVNVKDALGAEVSQSIQLSSPASIEIELIDKQNLSEKGESNGYIKTLASGGVGRLKYMWSTGSSLANISNLSAGKYTLTVTDKLGCTKEMSYAIQDAKNIPELTSGDVEVGKILTINNLNFEADSTQVTSINFEVLDEIVEFLEKYTNVSIEIGGHTNTIPPHEYCDKLSTARAKSVATYLTSKGISSQRVAFKGYGKRKPLIASRSLEARRKNQRVEIRILKI